MVAAVLSVLASAAIPQYRRSIYKTRRAEAFFGLRSIHDHQIVYHAAHNMQYTDSFRRLGTPLEGGKLRDDGAFEGKVYTFSLDTWDLGSHENANYRATATGDIDPTDETLDIIIIENNVKIIK